MDVNELPQMATVETRVSFALLVNLLLPLFAGSNAHLCLSFPALDVVI